jgi:iron(III) transport system permease protein
MRAPLVLLALVLALPVLGLAGTWLALDAQSWETLAHQADTVLPGYLGQTLLLSLSVAAGVALVGGATAAAVALFQFPGRRWFEWALLLPLSMPAYVLAYAYTDALQFSGPVQTALRAWTGAEGALWPDVRSLPGAVALFVLCLYPYVYLLMRAALAERAVPMMEAARMLGAGLRRRMLAVALPLARPALAAGVALALMETVADYGVGAYFGLTTLTTGIYRAWLVLDDTAAAAQLASVLLVAVALLLAWERRAQARMRFAVSRPGAAQAGDSRPLPLRGAAAAAAFLLCALPVIGGFVAPVAILLWRVAGEWQAGADGVFTADYLARFGAWGLASFQLAVGAALLGVAVALWMGHALRSGGATPSRWLRWPVRAVALGYAVPGAVVAIGILLLAGALQAAVPGSAVWITGTVLGVMYAYLVRFCAVALQSVEAGYARLPRSLDETSRLLGTAGGALFARVHLPLLRRSTAAAALLVFVDVMKELPATLVLRPFGSDTLAVVAYQFARDERLAEAALPSLAIVAVGLVPVLLLARATAR